MTGNLTERQAKWFASVRAGLERETGRTLEEWTAIALTCPETGHRARLKWLKDNFGLGQNRASYVLDTAFPSPMADWDEPRLLRDALWTDPKATAILTALEAKIAGLSDVVPTQRKAYSAFSRKVQFAAIKPYKTSQAILGLAIAPEADPRLSAAGKESWSERLIAKVTLTSPDEIDDHLVTLIAAAWARS